MKKSLAEFDYRSVTREPQQFVGARIVSKEGFALGACTICNLTRSGAMLRATCGLELQTGMGLLVDGEEDIRSFDVVWQTATHSGVRFIAADAVASTSPSDSLGHYIIGSWYSTAR